MVAAEKYKQTKYKTVITLLIALYNGDNLK